MFKKILVGLVAVIVLILGIAATQPDDYRITRSARFSAPPSAVFAQINDFQKWNAWSPWAQLDPNAKYAFEGPASGTGSIYKWVGNDKVGEGDMTILESMLDQKVSMKLHFVKPFEDTATAEFSLRPEGNQTEVTWAMFGKRPFVSKLFCMFVNMDKMLGGDFEKGLASMKTIVEAVAKN
jgi:hypothetical protein